MELDLTKRVWSTEELGNFASILQAISSKIRFKVSSRGWAYILEQQRYINKDQFDKAQNLINKCRKEGILPINFVAEESARAFSGVETPSSDNVVKYMKRWLSASLSADEYYTPDWWDGEDYYIQMVVEKIDLVTLFQPVCDEYHIPIANAKGWSSMLQRAEYARRFREAEDMGLECVLLYCGDHDPDGLRISEFIRKNLVDVSNVVWDDGKRGYDPSKLNIERFGLNFDFIERHSLTWIDNLITGSGKNLASPDHKNFGMPYVQAYLQDIGERKCEANAIVTMPDAAGDLVRESIESFVGEDAKDRFEDKRQEARDEFEEFLDDSGAEESIRKIIKQVDEYER